MTQLLQFWNMSKGLDSLLHRHLSSAMFIDTLFTTAKKWKQTK